MDDPFVQLDREETAEKMQLERLGRERGSENQPPFDSRKLDTVESDIVNAILEHANRAQIAAHNHARVYQERLSSCRLLHELGTIKAATRKALGDFQTLDIDFSNRLANQSEAVRASYDELRAFKQEHALLRPAHPVDSRFAHYSWIALAWLAEAVGNSFFLRENDELGVIGGVVAAMVIAFLNVAVAVLVGRAVWPLALVARGLKRAIAIAGAAVWVGGFLIGWNLLAAHYRDAKAGGIENPESAALDLIWQQPFGLDSFYSWALFFIGIMAAVVAANAGYRMDDPFPGYGPIDRRHRERCEDYTAEVAEANRRMTEKRDDAIAEAQSVKRQLNDQYKERGRVQAGHAQLVHRFAEHQDVLEHAANHLLSVYRLANSRARAEPSPARFEDSWQLARKDIEPLHDEPLRQEDIQSAAAALDQSIDEIASAFEHSISKLKPLDELRRELFNE